MVLRAVIFLDAICYWCVHLFDCSSLVRFWGWCWLVVLCFVWWSLGGSGEMFGGLVLDVCKCHVYCIGTFGRERRKIITARDYTKF